jgi:hypothetical protein
MATVRGPQEPKATATAPLTFVKRSREITRISLSLALPFTSAILRVIGFYEADTVAFVSLNI